MMVFYLTAEAIASSMLSMDTQPGFAIDGKFYYVFHSGYEYLYPWIQTRLSKTTLVETVTIVNRIVGPDQFDSGYFLKDVEIRTGTEALFPYFQGLIMSNHLCGHFQGPGEGAGIYTIKCDDPVSSDYVTVQVINPNHRILQITEILVNEFKSTQKGKIKPSNKNY